MRVIEFVGYIEVGKDREGSPPGTGWQELELDIEVSVHEADSMNDVLCVIEGVCLMDTGHSVMDLVTPKDLSRLEEEAFEIYRDEVESERSTPYSTPQTWSNRP